MVYNAMKLFMEINPQLFDDCSHEYNEHQNNAEEREKTRRDRWELLMEQAEKRKKGILPPLKPAASFAGGVDNDGVRGDETDPLTQDSQKRLNALKLQDEATTGKDRRTHNPDRQNSVSISGT
jgi:serine/threonine-protein phosphatase 2A regulatory subunit B'